MGEPEVVRELESLISEQVNPRTVNVDRMSVEEILRVRNDEDKKVAYAVEKEIPNIAKAVRAMVRALRSGGRVIYVGAGTSGRLGIVDRAELISTFGMDRSRVVAVLAGGTRAVFGPSEMAEDSEENGIKAMRRHKVGPRDVVVGISASGRTPYVVGALKEARRRGAITVALTVNPNARIARYADVVICPVVGPEVIMGSTRMKAGTAQKMVLTMMSTAAMIKLGRVKGNLMISLLPISTKLRERAKRIVSMLAGVGYETAARCLEASGYDVRAAVVMARTGASYEEAVDALRKVGGDIAKAAELLASPSTSSTRCSRGSSL